VTILPSDGGFQSGVAGCGPSFRVVARKPPASVTADYAIGIAIAPGTYSAPGSSECYWEQDSDFLDAGTSIISNNFGSGPVTVDAGPECGEASMCRLRQPGASRLTERVPQMRRILSLIAFGSALSFWFN